MTLRIIDTLKDLPDEMKVLTEGKPYAHIFNGGLETVDASLSDEEVEKVCKQRIKEIVDTWNWC